MKFWFQPFVCLVVKLKVKMRQSMNNHINDSNKNWKIIYLCIRIAIVQCAGNIFDANRNQTRKNIITLTKESIYGLFAISICLCFIEVLNSREYYQRVGAIKIGKQSFFVFFVQFMSIFELFFLCFDFHAISSVK